MVSEASKLLDKFKLKDAKDLQREVCGDLELHDETDMQKQVCGKDLKLKDTAEGMTDAFGYTYENTYKKESGQRPLNESLAARLLAEAGSAFKKLSSKIQRKEGYSKKTADATAAAIGRKKYGKKGMAKKAAAGRAKAK